MATTETFFEALVEAVERRGRVGLATVVYTRGSAPRGAGAQLFLDWASGESVGTVGGGAIEAAVLREMKQGEGKPLEARILEYRLHPNEVADLGMICGGNADILIQELTQRSLPLLQSAKERMRRHRSTILGLTVETDGLWAWDLEGNPLEEPEGRVAPDFVESENVETAMLWKDGCFSYPLQLPYRTLIFGGGHVSQALIQTGQNLDLRFTVFEDREGFANPALFPSAEAVLLGSFEKISDTLQIRSTDQVCILTRGHLCDSVVLKQVLATPARYIGMMGSRRKILSTMEKLREEGYSEADIQRIHAPIGLDIGAETPEEIAVSILAELVSDRRKPSQSVNR